MPGFQIFGLPHVKAARAHIFFGNDPGNCPRHVEGHHQGVEDVDEEEIQELVAPEEMMRGEPRWLEIKCDHEDEAGDQYCEDRPQVEQVRVLLEGDQVSAVSERKT